MLSVKGVTKSFEHKHGKVTAVENASFEINKGEFLAITGPSGSGKSTLLLAMGGMSAPDGGDIMWDNSSVYKWDRKKRAAWRGRSTGFLFQTFNLIPYLTIRENIELCLGLSGNKKAEKNSVTGIIEKMNLAHRANHLPGELSVGEQQRAALARALVKNPEIMFADEPTGNLDPENAAQILASLKEISSRGGTVVVVTHDPRISESADRVLKIKDGKIIQGTAG
jgi:putative ABC transport system ATP-binding protein